jgi:hypothetical protein
MAFENLKVYGSKLPNYDEEAKIFYGVVAQNSLNSDVVSDILFGSDTTDLSYESARKTLMDQIENAILDRDLKQIFDISLDIYHIWDKKLKPFSTWDSDKRDFADIKEILSLFKIEEFDQIKEILEEEFNQNYEIDGSDRDFEYKSDGYIIINCLNYDLMIIKSPYYCFAPECSPCVPCAGDLDSIREGREYKKKTYCLGKDFYEEENEPEFKIFNVSDDKEVI